MVRLTTISMWLIFQSKFSNSMSLDKKNYPIFMSKSRIEPIIWVSGSIGLSEKEKSERETYTHSSIHHNLMVEDHLKIIYQYGHLYVLNMGYFFMGVAHHYRLM